MGIDNLQQKRRAGIYEIQKEYAKLDIGLMRFNLLVWCYDIHKIWKWWWETFIQCHEDLKSGRKWGRRTSIILGIASLIYLSIVENSHATSSFLTGPWLTLTMALCVAGMLVMHKVGKFNHSILFCCMSGIIYCHLRLCVAPGNADSILIVLWIVLATHIISMASSVALGFGTLALNVLVLIIEAAVLPQSANFNKNIMALIIVGCVILYWSSALRRLYIQLINQKRERHSVEKHYWDFFHSVLEPVVVIDELDAIVEANNSFLQMLEAIDKDYISPLGQSIFKFIAPASEVQFKKILNMEETGDEVGRAEIQLLCNRQPIPTIVRVTECPPPYNWRSRQDHVGTLYKAVCFKDLTSAKQAEQALQEAQHEKKANKAKTEFLSNMSHEIRTPLNGLMGSLQLMSDTNLSSEQQELVRNGNMAAQVLLSLISNILDFSKIEAGAMVIEEHEFKLSQTLQEVVEWLYPLAVSRKLDLHCSADPRCPDSLLGDSNRLKQVLMNLLSNALKFTSKGHVRVNYKVLDNTKAGGGDAIKVYFEVIDTGIGISTEQQKMLFKRFHQVVSSRPKNGGTGLGLAIIKKLVNLMGGEVGVRSEEHKGSTFWFTVQFKVLNSSTASSSCSSLHSSTASSSCSSLHSCSQGRITLNSSTSSTSSLGSGSSSSGGLAVPSNHTVIVLSENETVQDILGTYLAAWGYNHRSASSLAEAKDIVSNIDVKDTLAPATPHNILLFLWHSNSISSHSNEAHTLNVMKELNSKIGTKENNNNHIRLNVCLLCNRQNKKDKFSEYMQQIHIVRLPMCASEIHKLLSRCIISSCISPPLPRFNLQFSNPSTPISSPGGAGGGLTPARIAKERRDSFLTFTPFQNNIPNFDVEAPYHMNGSSNSSSNPSLSPIKELDGASNPNSPAIERADKASSPAVKKPFVLVVEDNMINQRVMSAFLRREGVTFELACNGQEAINKVIKTTYDAIFMDINMPIVDGYSATRQIREMEAKGLSPPTPIIAMTAHAFSGDREKCLAAGMSEYLCKPIKIADLRQILTKLTPRSGQGSQ